MSAHDRRMAAIAGFTILLAIAQRVTGQSAVSMSLPGQEDLSFWVNHNGLLQFEVEGAVGFGDLARVLLRRRANDALITPLREDTGCKIEYRTWEAS